MSLRALLAALCLTLPSSALAADGILLAVSTSNEARAALRAGVTGVPGVAAVAEAGRRQMWLVRSRDAAGAIVQEAGSGFRYPLDALVIDPPAFASLFNDHAVLLRSLGAGDAVLGESSAQLRRIGVGGRLEMAD